MDVRFTHYTASKSAETKKDVSNIKEALEFATSFMPDGISKGELIAIEIGSAADFIFVVNSIRLEKEVAKSKGAARICDFLTEIKNSPQKKANHEVVCNKIASALFKPEGAFSCDREATSKMTPKEIAKIKSLLVVKIKNFEVQSAIDEFSDKLIASIKSDDSGFRGMIKKADFLFVDVN